MLHVRPSGCGNTTSSSDSSSVGGNSTVTKCGLCQGNCLADDNNCLPGLKCYPSSLALAITGKEGMYPNIQVGNFEASPNTEHNGNLVQYAKYFNFSHYLNRVPGCDGLLGFDHTGAPATDVDFCYHEPLYNENKLTYKTTIPAEETTPPNPKN